MAEQRAVLDLAIFDSESIRRFVGVELGEDQVPDESNPSLPAFAGAARPDEGGHRDG